MVNNIQTKLNKLDNGQEEVQHLIESFKNIQVKIEDPKIKTK